MALNLLLTYLYSNNFLKKRIVGNENKKKLKEEIEIMFEENTKDFLQEGFVTSFAAFLV